MKDATKVFEEYDKNFEEFKKNFEELISQAKEYDEFVKSFLEREGGLGIDAIFLQAVARDILAIPDRGIVNKPISKDAEKM